MLTGCTPRFGARFAAGAARIRDEESLGAWRTFATRAGRLIDDGLACPAFAPTFARILLGEEFK